MLVLLAQVLLLAQLLPQALSWGRQCCQWHCPPLLCLLGRPARCRTALPGLLVPEGLLVPLAAGGLLMWLLLLLLLASLLLLQPPTRLGCWCPACCLLSWSWPWVHPACCLQAS